MERQYVIAGLRIALGFAVIGAGLVALVASNYAFLGLVAAGAMMLAGLTIIGGK